ncbi:MAG TPA: hypothetical protein VIT68_01985 [Candidatus Gracilibacteria bacterium]
MTKKINIRGRNQGFNPGKKILQWEPYDYHPHQRGILWFVFMSAFVFGSAAWSYFYTDLGWIPAGCILLTAALYFWTHRNGHRTHEVVIFEEGILVDKDHFFPWSMFKGYWVLYDQHSSLIHFQRTGKRDNKVSIQLGHLTKNKIIQVMGQTSLPFLPEYSENLLDLWIRALKL